MTSLAELLAPLPIADFLEKYYARSFLHLVGNAAVAQLGPSWNELNSVLNHYRLEWPQVRVVKAGVAIPLDNYTEWVSARLGDRHRRLVSERFANVLADGSTLVIDSMDEIMPELADLANDVEAQLQAATTINLYASWSSTEGFRLHWDDHDVLVVQLYGSKKWHLHRPTRDWPLERDVVFPVPPEGDPEFQLELTEGDCLYLPHGWWHVAQGKELPSVHLTIGIKPVAGLDFLQWLIEKARNVTVARERIPRHLNNAAIIEHSKRLLEVAKQALDEPESIFEFLTEYERQRKPRVQMSLPVSAMTWEELPLTATVRMASASALIRPMEDKVALEAAGRRWTFASPARPLLEDLVAQTRQPVPVKRFTEAFGPTLGEPAVKAVLHALVTAGILTAAIAEDHA